MADFLELDSEKRKSLFRNKNFILNLPLRLAEKIEKNTLEDPLLRQFVGLQEEALSSLGYQDDPVDDQSFRCSPKMLKKYEGRALLVTTAACAMHCRYCFRQNFSYETQEPSFEKELAWIAQDTSLHEVILSGGDPLSLPDKRLAQLLQALSGISHVQKIRFHTRFPIGIPERITDSFLALLQAIRPQVWFVVHINHPRELDQQVVEALAKIRALGIPLLNQSVLLKGVNNDVSTLYELMMQLIDHGIVPYYLHQLDRVQGAAHFEVEQSKGEALIEALRSRLPGYAVPTYVQEIPGKKSKTPLLNS